METLTSEEKAPGAVPSRMLAVAETMIESFIMFILEYYGNESGGACGACEVTWLEEFQSCFLGYVPPSPGSLESSDSTTIFIKGVGILQGARCKFSLWREDFSHTA
jgi:hypothetical protein